MGEVIERKNPLVDHLNAIARLNQMHGTRAEGGAGVPTVEVPPAVAGGVSLPPPVPLSPEEEAEAKAMWEADLAERAGRTAGIVNQASPVTGPQVASQNFSSARGAPLTDFVLFDLRRSVVVADNGEEFPIVEQDLKELKRAAFNIAVHAMNQQIKVLATGLGIALPNTEAVSDTNAQAVSEVPEDESGK
jgi:hypothetical protein